MGRVKNENLKHVIYTSRPTFFDIEILDNILNTSRTNNTKWDITGNLVFHSDLFLQLLEGPPDAIDSLYQDILLDNRHTDIFKLRDEITQRRLFASWTMKNDIFQSWMLSRGALNQLNSEDAFDIFVKLARETDQFLDKDD
tara:strand:- start:15 stop:437 length:423 start_codon:yes stop_codon:yes gene_type:complete